MAQYYLDSSALVKRYVAERGTSWISSMCDAAAGHTLYIVRISGAEIIAALFRRSRAGSLSLLDAQADLPYDYQIVEVTEALVNTAMTLAERHSLRGYDAVQLAAALELQTALTASGLPTLTLVSADAELNTAAAANGLMVEDPNLNP